MMAPTHMATGAPLYLAVSPLVTDDPVKIVAGTFIAAYAALGPDCDHHSARATRALGPIGWLTVWFSGRFMGGHRGGTHSYFMAVVVGVVAALCGPLLGFVTVWDGGGVQVWLGAAIGVGWIAHILGDQLTPQPCALFWPFKRKKVKTPVTIASTGGVREKGVAFLLGVATVWLVGVRLAETSPVAAALLARV